MDSSDLSKPIANAKFRFEAVDGSFGPVEYTTLEDGTIDLSELPTGAYVVTELECPGYVIDDAQRIIQLEAGQTAEFVFTNSKLPSLTLTKLSSDGSPLAGTSYSLTRIEDGSRYMDQTTSTAGTITWEGLEPGVYSLKETDTVSDHILDTKEYHVELFPGKDSTIVLENSKRPNLTVVKRDADSGAPVADAVFLVEAADGHSVDELKTGADGTATLENLLPGVYEVTEKSVPAPYLLDAEPQLVTLYPDRDRTVYFENHRAPVIEIIKENEITHDPIENVPFQIWYASNNTSTGEYNDLGVYYTDEEGRIVLSDPELSLRDGWFRIEELEPPKGFSLTESSKQKPLSPPARGTPSAFITAPTPPSWSGSTTAYTRAGHRGGGVPGPLSEWQHQRHWRHRHRHLPNFAQRLLYRHRLQTGHLHHRRALQRRLPCDRHPAPDSVSLGEEQEVIRCISATAPWDRFSSRRYPAPITPRFPASSSL